MPPYFEVESGTPFDPTAIVTRCIESGQDALLCDEGALPPAFFDLSSGLAGELLHKLSTYRMRLAAVVPDLSGHSANFQAFATEANQGRQFHFCATRQAAIDWLASL